MKYPCERDDDLSRIEERHTAFCAENEPLAPVRIRRHSGPDRGKLPSFTEGVTPSRWRPGTTLTRLTMDAFAGTHSHEDTRSNISDALDCYVDYERDRLIAEVSGLGDLAITNV